MGDLIRIPISKAGKNVTFDVDTDDLNEAFESNPDLLKQLVSEGLKVLLNSRMSKLGAPTKLEGDELAKNKEAALAKASENFADFKAGKLAKKSSSAKTAGVDRAVMTEAVRLAKNVVKDQLRKAKVTLSTVPAKDITEAAKKLVEADPQYLLDAKANIEERSSVQVTAAIDILAIAKPDPKLVAKAEADKAAKKAERQLSKTQAGKTEKRAGKVPPRRPGSEVRVN